MSLLLSQLSGSATLTADAGAFSLSGQSATFAVTLTVAPGAFSLAGLDDLSNSALVTAPGSHALAGIDSAFAITLSTTTGAFDVAGISAEFSVGGEQPADVVAPAGGSFSKRRWRELAHKQPPDRERPAARQEIRLRAKGGHTSKLLMGTPDPYSKAKAWLEKTPPSLRLKPSLSIKK